MKYLRLLQKRLLKNRKLEKLYRRIMEHPYFFGTVFLLCLYLYGICIHSLCAAMANFISGSTDKTISLNPILCIHSVFTSQGLGVLFFTAVMVLLMNKKWVRHITGVKLTEDVRGFTMSDEGTHGTSGWMREADMEKVLQIGTADGLPCPILCKLKSYADESDRYADYVGLRTDTGLNSHTMVYGASGTGKSRGFVKPYILKMAKFQTERRESMILVDPKGEFFESMSEFLRRQGYDVKAFNLLDMEYSDAWNCIGEIGDDPDMVQSVAEIIIRNTADNEQKADFWDKAEKNLLVALILYVQSMCDPITGALLPIQERSLGTIYTMLSTEGAKSLDEKFRKLPLDHPARAPYGIFKQAASNLWGNIIIGLGSRLSVFQNKLVNKITCYHEIDMELPGKRPCAYFCIISAQDSAYEFLSSLFFSLLFKRLSDYARRHGNEYGRLPVPVNFVLDEFCNIGRLLDFKKTISLVRGFGINCHVIIQSIAQLADRYPVKEWEEIVGNCDTQLFLGCNDTMTSEYISKRCGNVTIRLSGTTSPQTPLFSPFKREVTGYRESCSNSTRPLMYPDEVLQLDNRECLLLIRGQKPLRGFKIIPDEISAFRELTSRRICDYKPQWHEAENSKQNHAAKQAEYTVTPQVGAQSEKTVGKQTDNAKTNTGVRIHIQDAGIFDPESGEVTEMLAEDILRGDDGVYE